MHYLQLFPVLLLLACCGIQSGCEQSPQDSDKNEAAAVAQEKVAQEPGNGDATKLVPLAQEESQTEEEEEALALDGGTGMDPQDILFKRGAQQMLDAEKRLKEMLKAGKIKGIDLILPFEEISSWPYQDGLKGMPKRINKLTDKQVLMTGFMLPIDEVENIKEFLLVQSLWSCCYGQPPDINGVVRVVMKGKKRIDYEFEPIKVIGKFIIKPTIEDGFCVDIYQLETDSVEVIK